MTRPEDMDMSGVIDFVMGKIDPEVDPELFTYEKLEDHFYQLMAAQGIHDVDHAGHQLYCMMMTQQYHGRRMPYCLPCALYEHTGHQCNFT